MNPSVFNAAAVPAFLAASAFSAVSGSLAASAFTAVFVPAFLAAAAFTDVSSHRIPNLLVLAVLFPGGFLLGPPFLLRLLCTVFLFFPLFRLRLMGAGDIKLLAAVAAWTGAGVFSVFFAASLIFASVPALILLLRGRRHSVIPMGPFFLLGWAAVNIAGIA